MASSFFLLLLFLLPIRPSSAQQNLTSFSTSHSPWTPLSNLTLLSPNSTFAAGFLPLPTTSSSTSRFLFSIWVLDDPTRTAVWSHDPEKPVYASASLSVNSSSGRLSLIDPSTTTLQNLLQGPTLQPNSSLTLSDAGELTYGQWTSFDFPTDTILPGQSLPLIRSRVLTSGLFALLNSSSLAYNLSDVYWTPDNDRSRIRNLTEDGQLVGPIGNQPPLVTADYRQKRIRRLTLDPDGNLRVHSLNTGSGGNWTVVWRAVQEICTVHGICGPNSLCVPTNVSGYDRYFCACLPGFERRDGSCIRKIPMQMNNPQVSKFIRLDYVNFTGGVNQTNRRSHNFVTCESDCLEDPACLGFAYKFIGDQYCVHQIGRLLYGYWSPVTQVAFFVRVHSSETDRSNYTGMTTSMNSSCPIEIGLPIAPEWSTSKRRTLAITGSLFSLELIIGILSFWAFLRKYSKYRDMARVGMELVPTGGPKRFSYAELKSATNDFSDVVGRGGYGIVYRGKLSDGQVIAVKRLKSVAPGGEADFWAEVTIIARMHHLNLVRMWGFCADKGEHMLVYEYVPNGSLDKFLFSRTTPTDHSNGPQNERPILDWGIRYRIAIGVARAIAYLHEECLEWVLHCDIKPENILLENDFCPKVSDFGLAKLAKTTKDMVTMSRIRGTRGYMAPEWVKEEPITSKADVYSYGMVLLELVSGTRNFDFTMSELDSEDWYFPKWAYEKVYVEKKVVDILDPRIVDECDSRVHYPMIDRMVKTAMWCLQDRPETRPSMGKVAKMLEGTVEILEPGKPTIFYLEEETLGHAISSS